MHNRQGDKNRKIYSNKSNTHACVFYVHVTKVISSRKKKKKSDSNKRAVYEEERRGAKRRITNVATSTSIRS